MRPRGRFGLGAVAPTAGERSHRPLTFAALARARGPGRARPLPDNRPENDYWWSVRR